MSYTYPDNNGFYTMFGNSGTDVTNGIPDGYGGFTGGYPDPLVDFIQNDPPFWNTYYRTDPALLTAAPYGPIPSTVLTWGITGDAQANNNDTSTFVYAIPAPIGPAGGVMNGGVTVHSAGQLYYRFKLTWNGSQPQPAYPDHINLLLKTHLSASATANYYTSAVQSGLTATATASDPAFNETASATAGDASDPGGVPLVIGYHLVHSAVDPVMGIAQVYFNGFVDCIASNSIPYGTVTFQDPMYPQYNSPTTTHGGASADASATAIATVRVDNRGVTISSPIEDSYYKGVYDQPHGTDRYLHLRDPATGDISVDSVAEYHSDLDAHNQPTGYTKGWQINGLPITANASDFQAPSYTWSLSGLTTSQAWLQLPTSTPKNPASFYLRELDQNQFPLNCTVRVDVSDNDGALASNTTYGITWHLPFEKNELISTTYTKKKYGTARASNIHPGGIALRAAVPPSKISLSAVLDAGATITASTGQEEYAGLFEIAAKLAEVANVEYEYGGQEQDSTLIQGAMNSLENWGYARGDMDEKYTMADGDTNILPTSFKDDPSKQALCKMSWWVIEKDINQSWYGDGYDLHGYDGNSHHVLNETHVEGMDEQPFFVQYKTADGTIIN